MKQSKLVCIFLSGSLFFSLPSLAAVGKGEKEAIEKLTSEVIILQRQVRDMQESMNRMNGQLIALVNQIGDKVAITSQSIQNIQVRMQDTQSRVSSALTAIDTRMLTADSNFRIVNERLAQALDQLSAINQSLTTLKVQPGTALDLTDPVLSFTAAYGDFLQGHYQLAIEQFRQFISKFPQSEQADDAQYWIGEAFLSQGLNEQAIVEFDILLSQFPAGDKVPAAKLKKGFALIAAGNTNSGVSELRELIHTHPDSMPAAAARQRLEELGIATKETSKPTRSRRTQKP